MSQVVHIPEDLYARIASYAAEQGQTPDDLLVALLEQDVAELDATDEAEEEEAEYDPSQDPFSPFIGAFEFGIPDLTTNLHKYLADAYAEDHEPEK